MRNSLYILAILSFVPANIFATDESIVLSYDFDVGDDQFSAHLILPPQVESVNILSPIRDLIKIHKNTPVPTLYSATYLLTLVEQKVLAHYEEKGMFMGPDGAAMREKLTTIESSKKGRSAVVFISSRNDIADIRAISRVDLVDKEFRLMDFESRLLKRGLDKPVPRKKRKFRYGDPETIVSLSHLETSEGTYFRFDIMNDLSLGYYQGAAELKAFISNDKDLDFIPLMAALLEAHDATRSYRRTPKEKYPTLIADYWLECDGKVRKAYFKRLGWHVHRAIANPDIKGSTTYIMRISRENFAGKLLKKIFARKSGFKIVTDSLFKFNPYQWRYVCSYLRDRWTGLKWREGSK